jgi:serine/threonine protein phosphatase PrpC
MSNFKLTAALLSDIGMKRKQNQDHGEYHLDLGLFIVADGMGGHQGGETASQLCVEKVVAHVEAAQREGHADSALLQQSLLIANQAIYELSAKEPSLNGMGTTATVLKITNNLATFAQVGDSRAYYWNKIGLWQLTQDHSLVQEKLRAGMITRDQVKTDEMKNVITRSVGYEMNMKVDLFTFEIEAGDGFLLCSDGLTGLVDNSLMFDILEETRKSGLSLDDAAAKLVKAANNHGGDDNVTVILVAVESSSPSSTAVAAKKKE